MSPSDSYYLSIGSYLEEKGIDAAVGPYGINTRERQRGCKAKLTNVGLRMWNEVIKPYFEAEAAKKEMIFVHKEEGESEPGTVSVVIWLRTENIVALGGPMKGVIG